MWHYSIPHEGRDKLGKLQYLLSLSIDIYCIKLKEKIQFCGFIINLFQAYGDPLQMEKGI